MKNIDYIAELKSEITRRIRAMNDSYSMADAARACGATLDAESYVLIGNGQAEIIRSLKSELADREMQQAAVVQQYQRGIQTRGLSL